MQRLHLISIELSINRPLKSNFSQFLHLYSLYNVSISYSIALKIDAVKIIEKQGLVSLFYTLFYVLRHNGVRIFVQNVLY